MKYFFLLFLLPGFALADWAKIPANEFSLRPPPKAGSAAYEIDFDEIHRWQETRTEEQCELGRSQERPYFDALFGRNWDGLTAAEQARAKPLLNRVFGLANKVYDLQKEKFRRPRPYNTDTTIEPCAEKPGGSRAYPSGHATVGRVGACVLALLFPEKAQDLGARGDLIGELRVIVGVHHPSDVGAGQILGQALCERLQEEEDFLAEIGQ